MCQSCVQSLLLIWLPLILYVSGLDSDLSGRGRESDLCGHGEIVVPLLTYTHNTTRGLLNTCTALVLENVQHC